MPTTCTETSVYHTVTGHIFYRSIVDHMLSDASMNFKESLFFLVIFWKRKGENNEHMFLKAYVPIDNPRLIIMIHQFSSIIQTYFLLKASRLLIFIAL